MSKQTMVRMSFNSLARSSPSGVAVAEVSPQQVEEQPHRAQKARKTFSLHIGGELRLPTPDVLVHSRYEAAKPEVSATEAASDPFEGLPFRALAERMGAAMSPVVNAVREDARAKRLQEAGLVGAERGAAETPAAPEVPHFLPFTRWASQSETMKATFVVDKASRPKARLSWYHPEDTMVPRGWWKMGLLEDLKYYKPFSAAS